MGRSRAAGLYGRASVLDARPPETADDGDGDGNHARPPTNGRMDGWADEQISADMRNFIHVNNYVLKAEHTPDLDGVVAAKLRAAAGLVHLDQKEYAKVTVRSFRACVRALVCGWGVYL